MADLGPDGTLRMAYCEQALPLLRSLPGARYDRDARCWRVSTAAADRRRILELGPQLAAIGVDLDPAWHAEDPAEAALRAECAARGLYPYQQEGACWLRARPRALLADEMGLGKTAQALAALSADDAALIVCPSSVKWCWEAECRRWRPDLLPTVLSGRRGFRPPRPGELVVVNYDILPPNAAASGCTFIVDEATMCRSGRARRTARVRALAATAQRVWLLSGTPLVSRPLDLWGVLRTGGLADEALDGWGGFVRAFRGRKNRWGGWEFGQPEADVSARLRRVMLRRLRAEVLPELPAVRYRTVELDTDAQMSMRLDEAWRSWQVYSLERQGITEPRELPPFERFAEARAALAAAKVPAMLALVEQYEETETPLVVFSAHRAPIDALGTRPQWLTITGDTRAIDREAAVRAFQAGELRGIGLTIQAGGYGLTLTHASHVLFVDESWTPAENQQARDRLCRIGQAANSVLVTRLVARHALDQRVAEILERKRRLIEAAVDGRTT